MTSQFKTVFVMAVALPLLLVGFQNCDQGNSASSSGSSSALSLSADDNGHPYSGAQPLAGAYYSRIPNFVCPTGSAGPQYPGVDKIITIANSASVATVVDNCTNAQTTVPVASLGTSQINSQYLTYNNSIFENQAQPPDPTTPVPLLLCNFPAFGSFLGFEQIIAVVPAANQLIRVSIYGSVDPQTGLPTPTTESPQPVVQSPFQYPEGVPAMAFSNPAIPYQLVISEGNPPDDPYEHPGHLGGIIAGNPIDISGVCVNPNQTGP